MHEVSTTSDEDNSFDDSEEWIAALARQLLRARHANDANAIEATLFYLEDYLQKTLHRLMRRHESEWPRYPSRGYRWFDGIGRVAPAYPSPDQLQIRSTISWVVEQGPWYHDPFEFHIELCPGSGAFTQYMIRFGDHRPLAAKNKLCEATDPPKGGWLFEFYRGRDNRTT